MTTAVNNLLSRTQGQHGFWLTNHADIIEPQVSSLIDIHGDKTALALIACQGNEAEEEQLFPA